MSGYIFNYLIQRLLVCDLFTDGIFVKAGYIEFLLSSKYREKPDLFNYISYNNRLHTCLWLCLKFNALWILYYVSLQQIFHLRNSEDIRSNVTMLHFREKTMEEKALFNPHRYTKKPYIQNDSAWQIMSLFELSCTRFNLSDVLSFASVRC